MKRERWTEADVEALPQGEHDFFERKSGRLFAITAELLGKLAKTVSAMANTGGGHIVLGVDDNGTPDGVPSVQGATSTRDWLEQKIPHLVQYPLSDFRVHVVEPSASSRVPPNTQVIVIDIGDSAMAPHQCVYDGGGARKHTYYYRQAGHSVPAPHFHLELLRQRLVSPSLKATPQELVPRKAAVVEGGIFLALRVRFLVVNTGRVAAYKWHVYAEEMSGFPADREGDYEFDTRKYPKAAQFQTGIPVGDDTLLPGSRFETHCDFGVLLRTPAPVRRFLHMELSELLTPLIMGFRVATETSPGMIEHFAMSPFVSLEKLLDFVTHQVPE